MKEIFKSRLFVCLLTAIVFTGVGVYAAELINSIGGLYTESCTYSNLSGTTNFTANDLLQGKTAYNSNCELITGTLVIEINYVPPQAGDTHKGIVYLDPADLSKKCNASSSVSVPGIRTGCMKFYIYDDTGDTYKMILDHNITAKVAYETSGTYKEYEQASIKAVLQAATQGWVGSPRLITANEVAAITNTTTFTGALDTMFYFDGTGSKKQKPTATSQGASAYAWLYDYTYECTSYGCNNAAVSIYGYWTSSPVSDNSSFAWMVSRNGDLSHGYVNYATGVRPVIELPKNLFNN